MQRVSDAVRDRLVDLVCAGLSLQVAGDVVGVSRPTAGRVWRERGHMELVMSVGRRGGLCAPAPAAVPGGGLGSRQRRALTDQDRAVIQAGGELGLSYRAIGGLIGRDKSVVWREVQRNRSSDRIYRGAVAQRVAARRRCRPKRFKLVENRTLCRRIEAWMDQGWAPRLIALLLAAEHDADHTRRVSHETIYQALYVQARGALRADLHRKLSLHRPTRVSRAHGRAERSPYRDAFKISDRPAEVADRAVPGHWEGDLIIGSGARSAIGTLVERTTRFTILLHLPAGHDADSVADAMIHEMRHLPEHLRRSITWDRGTELAHYARIQFALETKLFFCNPHSPWQRGTNENTNRLLRFWFAKGSDLSLHTARDLRRIAATLNKRPRPTLNLDTPADRLNTLLINAAA